MLAATYVVAYGMSPSMVDAGLTGETFTLIAWNVHRVDFKTQSSGAEEIPLVKAAKTVFVNGAPNVWELAVQAVPSFLVPLVRLLSRTFPSQAGLEAEEAFATIYGTSDTLIEVSYN